jgi:hypothetical protein
VREHPASFPSFACGWFRPLGSVEQVAVSLTGTSMSRSRQSRLSGTRMVEYTTGVNIPLYIWMDPYADFEN